MVSQLEGEGGGRGSQKMTNEEIIYKQPNIAATCDLLSCKLSRLEIC